MDGIGAPAHSIDSIVTRRTKNIDFIKRTFKGEVFWMNSIKLPKEEIRKFLVDNVPARRSEDWFCLGIGLGNILDLEINAFISALEQLWYEWEFHVSWSEDVQKWGDKTQNYNLSNWFDATNFESPLIYPARAAGSLDYIEIVTGLCDILLMVYNRLNTVTNNKENQIVVNRIDNLFKSLLEKVSGELNIIALRQVRKQLNSIQSLADANPL